MSRTLLNPMPAAITGPQQQASDPSGSVWVTANAGSGKTYVLTNRVLRLLLSGVAPEEILCLTYTKAAAAEMRGRVAERLAQWALMPDDKLRDSIEAIEGAPPGAGMLLRARSLFAHALETPGGLKIQTIHAFCESVLHRFPKEAGVPFDFTVIEDFERDAMLLEARETVIAAGLRRGENASAVETLFGLLSDFQIETAVREALGQQRVLRGILKDIPRAKAELHRRVGNPPSVEDAIAAIADGYSLTAHDHNEIFALLPPDPDGDDFVDRLSRIDPHHPDVEALYEAFLTKECTARKTLLKKATALLIPDVAEKAINEARRLELAHNDRLKAELVARSEAMLDIVAAISAHYENAKRARSLLDFDDLVEKLGQLLDMPGQGEWVLYKLDARISHILVDEGQDTNPQQWEVIRSLIAEFFFGESAAQRPRTLFVVGDQKQSIFSFQGADPSEFINTGRQVAFTARSVEFAFKPVPLRYSFRTLPELLRAVDLVFAQGALADGVLEPEMLHHTARADAGGMVTLWPPVKQEEEESDPDNWPTEAPLEQTQSAPRRVAEKIAREIKGWIDGGRPLGPRGKPITADDVLILVQVRSVLFHEIIRALIRAEVPTPGADRLAVTTHIGTLDLMALGDVLSNSADDLQLAALLRSPLFDVSEQDLFDTAQPRADKQSLWSAMETSGIASIQAARTQLGEWRARLDFERPFDFYSEILYRHGGLRKFRSRFGSEIDDVVAEFLELALANEQSSQPSLIGFLSDQRSRDVTIKRELAAEGTGVRVMTVHGAKGLEAPIVILADAASTEEGRDRRAVFLNEMPPLFIHASSKATHVLETQPLRQDAEAAQKAEYWRKLYVAMTRAEDELYVTGYLTKAREGAGSWYEAIANGLRDQSEIVADADGNELAMIFPRERPAPKPTQLADRAPAARATLTLPELPKHQLRRIVRPSRAADDIEPDRALDTTAERLGDPRDPEAARKEGIALHALLQHLARIEPAHWDAVAAKALPVLLPDSPAHAALLAKARSILTRPELAELFGPASRGEVPILAQARRKGAPITLAGRIDRLVVKPHSVLIVDYKSDARAPQNDTDVPPAYVTQLGLYALVARQLFPGHSVEAAILWTSLESLMNLPAEKLRHAVVDFTMG
ncbi:MAG: double-strand break repair helicase AddA [Hyphomicrobiales bacterium]|nr:MAG: double-strand break repair helicase AddA [Hyphomicrobiales bacterium]